MLSSRSLKSMTTSTRVFFRRALDSVVGSPAIDKSELPQGPRGLHGRGRGLLVGELFAEQHSSGSVGDSLHNSLAGSSTSDGTSALSSIERIR